MRQPLEPVGINAAGLHATAPGVEVSFDDDSGADHVAYRAGEFWIDASIHRRKDAAGVFRRQSAGVLPLAGTTLIGEVVDNDAFHKLPVIFGKAGELTLWVLDGGAFGDGLSLSPS